MEWTPRPHYAPASPQKPGTVQGESTFPPDLWRGLEGSALARLLAQVPLPSPSPTLAGLVARALTTDPEGAGGGAAMMVAALKWAGRVNELIKMLRSFAEANEPGALLAAGRTEDACAVQFGSEAQPNSSSKRATFLIPVYCTALNGDKASASQALDVARGNGVDVGLAVSAVYGRPPGAVAAAERAASLNIIDGETLAAIYRDAAQRLPKSTQTPAALRAKLFAALEGETSEGSRAESVDALPTSGKDARIEIPIAQAMAQARNGFTQDTQVAYFAEIGVRVAAVAGDEQTSWNLTEAAGARGRSWQLLLVTADPLSERAHTALKSGVDIVLKTGLPGPLLQRLVTVLDALGGEMPIPLWDLAAELLQPDDGYLPAMGVLSTLKDADDVGRTILLAACVFGPDGPRGAHLITLGDGLRAPRRVGLDAEARRLAFEALYAHWPVRGKA
jgi:hypothetical protein